VIVIVLMKSLFTTVPTPTVSVTTPSAHTVGQSLTLQCSGTTVRGITSRVDIAWRHGYRVVSTTRVIATTMDNSLVYNDSYTISQLNTTDDGVVYECRLSVREGEQDRGSQVRATDTVTLDVTGECFIIMYIILYDYLLVLITGKCFVSLSYHLLLPSTKVAVG